MNYHFKKTCLLGLFLVFSYVQCDVSHLPPEVLAAAAQRQHLRNLPSPNYDAYRTAESAPQYYEEATSTPPPPPHPYVFSYTAGRAPGHYDRMHSETSDGSGTVRGSFSYVDPRNEIRTVEYVADEHGFHPALSHPAPAETISVARARERHYQLYNKIAEEHAHNPHPFASHSAGLPVDTEAVEHARIKHLTLFEKIAAEHARIAAEREAEKAALELSQHNEIPLIDTRSYQH